MPEKANNGDIRFNKILEGIQYLIGDNKLLREDLRESSRRAEEDRRQFAEDRKQAAEDRKQAAEDRKQAAEDRREMKDLIIGIRKALVIIGKRGGDFVEIQKAQGAQLKRLTDIAEKNTLILTEIRNTLRPGRNGNGHSRGT